MIKRLLIPVLILVAAVSLASGAKRQATILDVTGEVPKALHLTMEDLQKMTHVKLDLKEHDGTTASYEGVPINEVLAAAGFQMAEHMRGKELAEYVLAHAQDDYEVVYGMGETEPSISGRTIIIAWSANDKALGAGVGPLRIVVEGDKKQARCIRMLTKLTVKKP
ncbi:MAG TPA: molybdopterin-dependent oxidoreductase [Fimbriimonadaceae bacterium]